MIRISFLCAECFSFRSCTLSPVQQRRRLRIICTSLESLSEEYNPSCGILIRSPSLWEWGMEARGYIRSAELKINKVVPQHAACQPKVYHIWNPKPHIELLLTRRQLVCKLRAEQPRGKVGAQIWHNNPCEVFQSAGVSAASESTGLNPDPSIPLGEKVRGHRLFAAKILLKHCLSQWGL